VTRRRRDDSTATTPGHPRRLPSGSRGTHSGSRKTLFRGVPSAPSLVGAAALVLAAVGALTGSTSPAGTSELAASGVTKHSAHASALSGSSSVANSEALKRREQAVSRDSQREALKDAADADLQQAAEQQNKERNAALAALAASAEKQAGLLARDAWQLPVTAGAYHLTSRFGECSSLWSHCHTGLDFAAPEGTTIHAIANGTVTEVGWAGAYGNRTIVTLEDGTELWYCHQSATGVQSGQKVTSGQAIGAVGSTGNVTGPHVHIEVRPGAGDPVDPYTALVAHGLKP
jgi:murein DD-endopeptidase MepM/ murein hydrolase activator NlpD